MTRRLIPALVLVLAATPPFFVEGGFSFGPGTFTLPEGGLGFGRSLFSRPMVGGTAPGTLLREREALAKKSVPLTPPKYEITETDEKFNISVDLPGMEASEISISIENDMLSLSGERKEEKDKYSFGSRFYQSFSLDPAIEKDKFKAEFKDGLLRLSAPKDLKKVKANIKNIPIMDLTDEEASDTNDAKETVSDELIELNDRYAV